MSDLLDLRTVNETWHIGPCAEVRVGDHVTRYIRRGSGPSVVLLGVDFRTSPVWRLLVEWLTSSYRVTVPQGPADGVDATEWFREFVEGLGLSSFVLFAGAELLPTALNVAALDDFTVQKLVLLPEERTSVGASSPRVLWLLPEWSPAEALRRVEIFLSTEESALSSR